MLAYLNTVPDVWHKALDCAEEWLGALALQGVVLWCAAPDALPQSVGLGRRQVGVDGMAAGGCGRWVEERRH